MRISESENKRIIKEIETRRIFYDQILNNGKGEEELDNEFELEGVPVTAEGKSKTGVENSGLSGNSQFLQTNTGHGAEYFSPGSGGRKYCEKVRTICLTCETDCDQKKQWKM